MNFVLAIETASVRTDATACLSWAVFPGSTTSMSSWSSYSSSSHISSSSGDGSDAAVRSGSFLPQAGGSSGTAFFARPLRFADFSGSAALGFERCR